MFFFYNSMSPLTNTLGRIVDQHALALASKRWRSHYHGIMWLKYQEIWYWYHCGSIIINYWLLQWYADLQSCQICFLEHLFRRTPQGDCSEFVEISPFPQGLLTRIFDEVFFYFFRWYHWYHSDVVFINFEFICHTILTLLLITEQSYVLVP